MNTIKERRLELLMSQRQLAIRVGATQAFICNVENGKVSNIDKVIKDRIKKVLGLNTVLPVDNKRKIINLFCRLDNTQQELIIQLCKQLLK